MKLREVGPALTQANPVSAPVIDQLPLGDAENAMLGAILEAGPADREQTGPGSLRHRQRPRRLLVAGAAAAAVAVAGALGLSSGPTAQPAAAELLHQTAAIAAATGAPAKIPGPGQFLYRKIKRLELESWVPVDSANPDEPLSMGGGVLGQPGVFKALMPTTQESWTAPDGAGRSRVVAGTPRFLTDEERNRWEAAGSRLPPPFDPEYQRKYPHTFGNALEMRRGVVDGERSKERGFGFPDTSRLPTEPQALRLAVERNKISVGGFNLLEPSATRLDTKETIAELFNILVEGNPMTPQLRAALFNALAELPGIEVDTGATDFLGRQGYAIRSVDQKAGGGMEYIFDPHTSEMLAERSFLSDARRATQQDPYLKGLPSGLTIRETAYLESAVVDSIDQPAPTPK